MTHVTALMVNFLCSELDVKLQSHARQFHNIVCSIDCNSRPNGGTRLHLESLKSKIPLGRSSLSLSKYFNSVPCVRAAPGAIFQQTRPDLLMLRSNTVNRVVAAVATQLLSSALVQ